LKDYPTLPVAKPRGTIKRFEVKWKSVLFPPLGIPWVSPAPSGPMAAMVARDSVLPVFRQKRRKLGFGDGARLPLAIDASAAAAGAKPIRVKF